MYMSNMCYYFVAEIISYLFSVWFHSIGMILDNARVKKCPCLDELCVSVAGLCGSYDDTADNDIQGGVNSFSQYWR